MHERGSREPRLAAAFGVLSAGSAALALGGGLATLWLWPAVSSAVVAAGYARGDSSVFGKRSDGSASRSARLLLLPYLGLAWLVWRALRASGENAHDEVAPGLHLGRRPLAGELPAETTLVVDLTAEFLPRVRGEVPAYVCLPILDGAAPSPAAFTALVRRVADHDGEVYLHCAAGHGRSAAVAAGVLLARGISRDAADAVEQLRARRPLVRMSRSQRALVAAYAQSLGGDPPRVP